ncbi:MAG: hypothetical protein EA428_14250 [Spirochaetaceae bacterium]|nr:MAG: hypothetical protein EA428_14250 [Spirochaetaceae bacterium]
MTRKKTKRSSGFGVLFWMAFILFVVALYLHNRSDIQQVLENTGLVETLSQRLRSDNGDDAESETLTESGRDSESTQQPEGPEPSPETPQIELIPDEQIVQDPATAPEAQDEDVLPVDTPDVVSEDSSTEPESRPETTRTPDSRKRDFPLYFIRVTDTGTIYPDRVVREVSFVDTPLTAMLQVLISGPNSQEIERGLHHLIPKDTRLISASVRGGVAYLNFNEAFQFNPLGIEGYLAQLKQIVYSTTEFPTVDAVQILIEGQEREFLGGDGVYIGRPLRRDSFG